MTRQTQPTKKRRWPVLLLIGFTVYFLIMMGVQQAELNRTKADAARLEEQIRDLERGNAEMAEQADMINTSEYIEYLVRLKLGWIKADELKFVGTED